MQSPQQPLLYLLWTSSKNQGQLIDLFTWRYMKPYNTHHPLEQGHATKHLLQSESKWNYALNYSDTSHVSNTFEDSP